MYNSPKEYFKQQYFEACDLLREALEKRFDQHQPLEPILALENLLLKACNGEPHEEDLNVLEASCYQDDLDCDKLRRQLLLCAEVIKQALPMVKKVTSVRTLCEAMKTNSTYKSMLSEVHKSLRLYLTISYHIGNIREIFFSTQTSTNLSLLNNDRATAQPLSSFTHAQAHN